MPDRPRSFSAVIWIWVPLLLVVLTVAALAIDLPVLRWVQQKPYPKVLKELFDIAETFGHTWGVVLITTTLVIAQPARWREVIGAGLCGVLSGLGGTLSKLTVARSRPLHLHFDLASAEATVWDTFGRWWPLGAGGSAEQSFASGHTASAVGFAVALGALFPRLRWWFYVLAILVGLHRVEVQAHFPSDVFAGGCIGWLIGHTLVAIWPPATGTDPTVESGSSALPK